MTQDSDRPVSDLIPPEARRRARSAGFSADADWYAGRDYSPSRRPLDAQGDDQRDRRLNQARHALRARHGAAIRRASRRPLDSTSHMAQRLGGALASAARAVRVRTSHLLANLSFSGHR